jgi:hypothetical protein
MNIIVMLHQCKKVLVTTKDRWKIWKLQMTLELKKALSFHSFCILFCKLVERLNAKPFSCVFYALSVWFVFFCFFQVLSLLKAFNLTKNSCVYALYACQCAFVFFFQGFNFYWKISKCSILYVAFPPLHLPLTTFKVVEISLNYPIIVLFSFLHSDLSKLLSNAWFVTSHSLPCLKFANNFQ